MGRVWLCVLVLAGCYSPAASPGAPCPDGDCPTGQTCIAGTCRVPGEPEPDAVVIAPDAVTEVDAPIDAPLGAFGTPTKIPGVNSTATESDPSMTADRLTIVFTSSRAGGLGLDDIYIGARLTTADPFLVTPLTIVSSAQQDRSPEISADGNTLFFVSNRNGNNDVYTSTRTGGAFTAPAVVTQLSTSSNENDIAISPDGLTALLSRSNDMYVTTRPNTNVAFANPILVPALDVTGDVAAPSLTNNADTVYLHAGMTRDLYVAVRQGNTFTTPVPIVELNTSDRDAAPSISSDNRRLLFERTGELYETTR